MREAVAELERVAGVTVTRRSKVYETAPVGGPPQPAFLNAAIAVDCTLSPLVLLDELQRIEADLGRTREVRWGPRAIDLDILWIEGVTVDEPRLVVPHPRLHERAFALLPLLDVAPHAPYAAPSMAGVALTALSLEA
jgi:2-amino-4-hydroxy-6-hydroxymethyldihydropteridine diphosphokinase